MASIYLLHISALGRRLQEVFHIKGIHAQHVNLGMHRLHWND